jgi:hypothetical protein
MKARWTTASVEFDSLCLDLNRLGEFEVTKDYIIRCLMVFDGYSAKYDVNQIRRSELMSKFEKIFDTAQKAIRSSFDFLVNNKGAGIRTYRLLSAGQRPDRGYNALIPIALYLYLQPSQEIPEKEYRSLRRFLYTSILSRYSVRYVESRIDKMAKLVRESHASSIGGFPTDKCIRVMAQDENFAPFHPEDLCGRSNTLDPLLNILHGGSIDFKTLLDRNAPERDHIFPQSRLRLRHESEDRINHFANIRLLGKLNNILKSNIDPAKAFANYSAEELAEDYLIPKDLLDYEKYSDFLVERERLIKDRVRRYLS